jgi:hypothetical protein
MLATAQLWLRLQLLLVLEACFIISAAADPGDDFVNNLFTDLTP